MKKFLSVALICTLCALTLTSCVYTQQDYYESSISQLEALVTEYDDFRLEAGGYYDVSGFDYIKIHRFDENELERVHGRASAHLYKVPYKDIRIDIEWKFTNDHIYTEVTCNRLLNEFEDIGDISMKDAIFLGKLLCVTGDEHYHCGDIFDIYEKVYSDLLKSDCNDDNRIKKEFNTHFCYRCMNDEEYRDYHIHRRMEMDYKADKYYFKGYQYEDTMIFTDDISR